MEYRLADQPEKIIYSGPELADITQRFGSVFKQVETVDTVAEPQDQTSHNNRRYQRRKDLCYRSHCALQEILIALRRLFHSILGYPFDSGNRNKIIVKIRHCVPDNDLELSCLRETALYNLHGFDFLHIRFRLIVQNKPHSRHTMRNRGDILLSADQFQKLFCVLCISAHYSSS